MKMNQNVVEMKIEKSLYYPGGVYYLYLNDWNYHLPVALEADLFACQTKDVPFTPLKPGPSLTLFGPDNTGDDIAADAESPYWKKK